MSPLLWMAMVDGEKKKNKTRNFGHNKGIETVKLVVESCINLKIPYVTFYVFSSENWKRPKKEISFLFKLIKSYFSQEIDDLLMQGIKINFLGELSKLPSDVKEVLKKTALLTKKNKKIIVSLAINYGSRNEIIRTAKKMKRMNINDFKKNLDTKNIPDPDILIRTGGYKRLSNFLLWQLAYTELFFLKKLWPDFKSSDLKNIIKKYFKIKRNFGSI